MTFSTERARAIADRRQAFAALADRELAAAYRLAGVILGGADEAEDATHDAVVAAWRSFGSLKDPAAFAPWLQRILVNTCRDRLRRRRRRPPPEVYPSTLPAAGDAYRQVNDRISLDEAFDTLSADHRIVVALRFYDDLTVDQIARQTGVPSGTVKSRLHAAMDRLGLALAGDREAGR